MGKKILLFLSWRQTLETLGLRWNGMQWQTPVLFFPKLVFMIGKKKPTGNCPQTTACILKHITFQSLRMWSLSKLISEWLEKPWDKRAGIFHCWSIFHFCINDERCQQINLRKKNVCTMKDISFRLWEC